MNCPKCKHKAMKLGTRPVMRKGAGGKRQQAYICTNPACYHQWRDKR